MFYILAILFLILVILLTQERRKVDILLSVLDNEITEITEGRRKVDAPCNATDLSHAIKDYHPACLTKLLREKHPLNTGHIHYLFQHKDPRITYHLLEIMIEESKDFFPTLELAKSLRPGIVPSEFTSYLRRREFL